MTPDPSAGESVGLGNLRRDRGDDGAPAPALRGLLWFFVGLGSVIAAIGAQQRSYDRAAISASGGVFCFLLLLALPRLGTRLTGILATIGYYFLEAGALATGKGVDDVVIVLFPAGMLMAALLLPRRLLTPFIGLSVATVAVTGFLKGARPAAGGLGSSTLVEVAVASLLLLVSGVLASLVVRILQARIAERRQAEEEAKKSRREFEIRNEALTIVNRLAGSLHRTTDIPSIAEEAVQALVRQSCSPLVAVYLLDEVKERLELVAGHGFTREELVLGAFLPLEGSLGGLALRERRIVSANDIESDDRAFRATRLALAARGIVSAIAIPLEFGRAALGSLNVLYRERRPPDPIDLETYQAIGQAVSLAIVNARHVEGLAYQAYHDPLTSLPNRARLHRDFRERLGQGGDGHQTCLVLVDLSRFREINDALGHKAGDELLVEIGKRLRAGTPGPSSTIYRLGSDEFVVLVFGLTDTSEVEAEARRLLALLAQPFEVAGLSLEVGAHAGVAVHPRDAGDSHELLRCADVALHRAKQVAGGVVAYATGFDRHNPERLALLSDLGKALRTEGLLLYYQPQVDLGTGIIYGFEALVRWQHPKLGFLSSSEFVPLAETSDVMNALTYWVVENALAQLARWHAYHPSLTMGVNLSVRNLLDRNCPLRLEQIIQRTGVDPSRVEFELTETAVMSDPEMAMSMLGRITSTGARLAIDDFGTGYFSLAYLKRFPVHAIKIDRSFVGEVASDDRCRAIVRSSIELAHSLGLRVVAEGIEDPSTADALLQMGCDAAQGYFFSYPEPADVIGRRLQRTRHLPAPPSGIFERRA